MGRPCSPVCMSAFSWSSWTGISSGRAPSPCAIDRHEPREVPADSRPVVGDTRLELMNSSVCMKRDTKCANRPSAPQDLGRYYRLLWTCPNEYPGATHGPSKLGVRKSDVQGTIVEASVYPW